MEVLGSVGLSDVMANGFFIAAGVALGVRVADDLMLWREHRAAKQVAPNR